MRQYIVDAFTNKLFEGNQAAVCVMEEWIPESLMKNIAKENNFSETAFTVKNKEGIYELRWFTPGGEIDFCGHATLGASFVLFSFYETKLSELVFRTVKKGDFSVKKSRDGITMTFPSFSLKKIPVTEEMTKIFGAQPQEAFLDRDLLCVFDDPDVVKNMSPNENELRKLDGLCIGVTAKSAGEYDCVSRVFAPKMEVYEDPVTGSTHCMIAPYWSKKLNKKVINAFQASKRGGKLLCEVDENTVSITGNAVLYSSCDLAV
jgi:predicted PhzF superfamily epimerase YddE/YHI9